MVLLLSAWGTVRWAAALSWWDVLVQYDARLSPLYLSITGAGWTAAGLVLLWSIWSGKAWSRRAIPLSVFCWLMQYWIERLFFQVPRANLAFMIAVSLTVLAVTLIATFNRKTRNFLLKSEAHEQPEQDRTSA
jgi:hypothetical protein